MDKSATVKSMQDLPKIIIHLGELDHSEVTGSKLVGFLRRCKAQQVIVEIDGRDPKPITSGDQFGREDI